MILTICQTTRMLQSALTHQIYVAQGSRNNENDLTRRPSYIPRREFVRLYSFPAKYKANHRCH
jgi:hypothetical protein